METELKMPDLATTGSTIKVLRWIVVTGQAVKRGQPLLEIETDKAVMEVESIATGTIKAVRAQLGDEISAGQVIAIIETEETGEAAKPPAPLPTHAAPETLLPAGPKKAGGMFARNRNDRPPGKSDAGTDLR